MKPLKTENEVGSNMKSTIKYTFVMPGNTPSKNFLPQSNDLVKKYIKEIETMRPEAIRKGLEKRSGSLSSSLGFSESEVDLLTRVMFVLINICKLLLKAQNRVLPSSLANKCKK
ncbi:hypothetical protein H5410_047843 [Solanum commersonii]|uniref:Uncharacterized protein n=1 Tax=Solanum commersonii TaxID=4109 RepID=A0A9J5XGB7_SOLCO|nr:hypothetical protein H5410_047843 [Solanum commersonii]